LLHGRIADWFAEMETNRQESRGSGPVVKRVLSGVILGILALATPLIAAEPITRIALGSCADQDKPQPIWEAIVAQQPQLFLFLGDNVYADTAEMEVMRRTYAKLGALPGYRKLKATCPILAIWDDHDYGVNDGGAEYVMREGAEKIFDEFFETPADSPARSRPGIYDSRIYDGGAGKRLQILMLDTRFFRGPLLALPQRSEQGPYDRNTDPSVTMLGEAQWTWLAGELAKPADLRLIMTSVQFLPQDHRWECWENFPRERERFLKLLAERKTGPVIFLSGDRHMGEIMELKTGDPLSPGFVVYELTSSGLTNAGGGKVGEPNRHRVGVENVRERNFGMVRIDWDRGEATLELREVGGERVQSHVAPFRVPSGSAPVQ
jgi:alkaline phosphatase D